MSLTLECFITGIFFHLSYKFILFVLCSYGDRNRITTLPTFVPEPYPQYMHPKYEADKSSQKPFDTITNLRRL